jgi:hypothetical protein
VPPPEGRGVRVILRRMIPSSVNQGGNESVENPCPSEGNDDKDKRVDCWSLTSVKACVVRGRQAFRPVDHRASHAPLIRAPD